MNKREAMHRIGSQSAQLDVLATYRLGRREPVD